MTETEIASPIGPWSRARLVLVAVISIGVPAGAGGCDESKSHWISSDASAGEDGGAAGFLQPCESDDQCGAGDCLWFGDGKRCSRVCGSDNPCPSAGGWTCEEGQCRCTPNPAGKVTDRCDVDGDCDGVADRPSMPEICNGIDDDCNGVIDDVAPGAEGAKLYYRDEDGDGFGDTNRSAWLCQPTDGWVENNADCDDFRADVNPDAVEICGNGVDNNCDGRLDDPDVCGLSPIRCPAGKDVDDPACFSATLIECGVTPGVAEEVDIREIIFKQDTQRIKYTVRLVGSPPIAGGCTAYRLAFGAPTSAADDLVYVTRLPQPECEAAGLPHFAAYAKGQAFESSTVPGWLVVPGGPGHVWFVIDQAELFQHVPRPTYRVRACTNAQASPADLTACDTDSCEALAHE